MLLTMFRKSFFLGYQGITKETTLQRAVFLAGMAEISWLEHTQADFACNHGEKENSKSISITFCCYKH